MHVFLVDASELLVMIAQFCSALLDYWKKLAVVTLEAKFFAGAWVR